MTETDTSRIERPCPNCGVTLNGWSGLRHCGYYITHAHADCINNLRRRAEKAEADLEKYHKCGIVEIAAMNPSVMDYMRHWEGRAEKAEAERDTAWNDAIEAAAMEMDKNAAYWSESGNDAERVIWEGEAKAIRALKKGDAPKPPTDTPRS